MIFFIKNPLIKSAEELGDIMSRQHGFVIFDQLAKTRLGEPYFSLLQAKAKQIFHEDKQPNSSVWVFKF